MPDIPSGCVVGLRHGDPLGEGDSHATVNAAIIYYSATGTVHALAHAAAEGAEKAGAEVRLRKVAELAPHRGDRRQPGVG